jgi:uncharacterized membrane protein YbhN (UPF0104 family)
MPLAAVKAIRRHHLILAVCGTLGLVAVVAVPGALRGKVGEAMNGLAAANAGWMWVAAAALVVMHACGGIAWSAALRACGTRTRHTDAAARYCVGSGVNAVAPAHLGSAARVALFGRAVGGQGAIWRVGGVAAAVGAVRAVWFSFLVVAAVILGPMPAWPLALLAAGAAAAAAGAVLSRRITLRSRLDHLLDAFRELGRSPRKLAGIGLLTLAALAAKVAAAAAIATALGIDNPWKAAALIVPAVELAAVMPVTPGNAGVASAAIAMALASLGVPSTTALAAGIAFGALETLCAVGVGLAGALALAGHRVRPRLRLAAVTTSWAGLACAVVVTVLPGL